MGRFAGPLIVGALAGTAIGAVVTWVVVGEGSGAPLLEVEAKSQRDRTSPDAGRGGPAPVEIAPITAERSDGSIADSQAPAELVDRVTTLARHASAPLARGGDKAIRGKVTDARGKPLAGVLIRATRHGDDTPGTPQRSELGRAPPPPPSLEEAVREAVEEFYERGSDFRETTTAADGSYAIAQLRSGRFSVEAWKEGLRFNQQGNGGEVRPDAKIDFIGKPVIALPVDVVLPDGKQAPSAYVFATVKGRGNGEATGWSPATPTLPLAPGDYEIKATLGDPNSGPAWPEFLSSAEAKVTIAEGEVPSLVKLTLKGEPGVRGRVLMADGTVAPGAQVRLVEQSSGTVDLKRLSEDGDAKAMWIENGEFLFRELKSGRYALGVCRDWRNRVLASTIVEVNAGMVVQDLVLPELEAAACVVVQVSGPDGEIVTEANFQWRVDRDKNTSQNDTNAELKEPGVWWLPIDTAGGNDFDPAKPWPPQTRLFLTTWTETLGSNVVEIFQATRRVDVRFGPPATLIVTVPGYVQGDYVGRIQLSLERSGEGIQRYGWGGGSQPDKDDGTAKIGPVEAGRYRLAMWIGDKGPMRWQQSEAASQELSLVPGENHVSMAIPQLHQLIVRMPEGAEGRLALMMVGKAAQRQRSAEVGKESTVTFGELPPGEWRLTATGGSAPGVMSVRVPAGGPIDFTPMNVTALRAVILDDHGLLAGAGFQDGDLVVAISGKEITSFLDLQLMQTTARLAKTVTFTVQRGAEKSDLTVESRFVNDYGRLGGSLEPATR